MELIHTWIKQRGDSGKLQTNGLTLREKTVVLKTLESPLDCKEIQPVHLKGNQSWRFFGSPGVLQSMGSQRVGQNWATELNWTEGKNVLYALHLYTQYYCTYVLEVKLKKIKINHIIYLTNPNQQLHKE